MFSYQPPAVYPDEGIPDAILGSAQKIYVYSACILQHMHTCGYLTPVCSITEPHKLTYEFDEGCELVIDVYDYPTRGLHGFPANTYDYIWIDDETTRCSQDTSISYYLKHRCNVHNIALALFAQSQPQTQLYHYRY